jgi:hypothetical protein
VNPSSRSCKIDWKIQIGIQKLEIEKEKEKNTEKKRGDSGQWATA